MTAEPLQPEDELLHFMDPSRSRAALETFGDATWKEALDWLYDRAADRPMGSHGTYPEDRLSFFGPSGAPSAAPASPSPWRDVFDAFRTRIAPATYNAQHPGSFSYFTPPPLPMSIAGEVLGQWIHQGVDVWHAGPVGALVEEEVVAWLRELMGMPDGSWGVLTSGGVMANLMALTVARDIHLARIQGEPDSPPRGGRLDGVRIYASDQTHFSVARGISVLGFPDETLHVVPSDERFRLHAEDVARAIAEDRKVGLTPFAISAVAGSTNTGSVDDVVGLADLAEREGLWFHVDAAYGGAARLSPNTAGRVQGLERADSVTVDPHKWFYQGYDIGGLLVRRREDLRATFHREPEYYRTNDPDATPLNWYHYSIEGTRRFRALKLWMSWKHIGTEGFAKLIEHDVRLAAHLAERCRGSNDFEVVPEVPELSVVCFRHVPNGVDPGDPALNSYQTRLQRALEVDGTAWVSTTMLRERTYMRAGFVNYLATEANVDAMLEALRALSDAAWIDSAASD
ncbi:MAG: aromatic-L-amino-acid/L-tryptophan decarboxylase [Actinomycetota bacterium]|nr:aromatic-L-amino-acid/L-tryptophan decarboxylase [Actinomycetota bacterium]